jgi:epoxyqueuosine reductase
MVDRVAAERAGLGFVGKSTCLLTGPLGSYVFLSVILTTAALDPDPLVTRDCGSCRACLDACPTGAFVGPGQLDATRCISYLTVEHRGAIADDLRPRMGDWVFGCDVCQEVCPWNRARPAARHAELGSRAGVGASLDLIELARMDHATYLSRFRGTALKRAHLAGLRRNAVIAMGNVADPETVPTVLEVLRDPDPVLRHHSAWALGRQASLSGETRRAMRDAASFEHDPWVYDEILAALARHGDGRAPSARLDEASG